MIALSCPHGAGGDRTLRLARLALLATLASQAPAAAGAPPERVVSINVCTDALLVELVPRERIVAISHLGIDPHYSPRPEALAGLPVIRGDADEVLALEPDLVVGGAHAARATVALLRRLGVPVVTLDLTDSIATARAQVRRLAATLGASARAERALAEMDRALAAVREQADALTPRARRPVALLLRPNGFTSGPRTLEGDLMALAGFANLAGELGIETWGILGLEQLLVHRPDWIITDRLPHAPSLASALLAHPALEAADARLRVAALATNLFTCPGPWLADAARALVALHARAHARR